MAKMRYPELPERMRHSACIDDRWNGLLRDNQCNTHSKEGARCIRYHRHDGDHEYGPVRVELLKVRVTGFKEVFETLNEHRINEMKAKRDGGERS